MTKPRLREIYETKVLPELIKEFGVKNLHAQAKITKVVINAGAGGVFRNKESLEALARDLSVITGQKMATRSASISVASFNVRRGMPVGLKATLRGERMYSFLDKLFSITLPRLRDFRGLPKKGFDNVGNYTLGFPEHTVFPEIDAVKAAPAHGFEITIVISAQGKEQAVRLLELLGMPFEK